MSKKNLPHPSLDIVESYGTEPLPIIGILTLFVIISVTLLVTISKTILNTPDSSKILESSIKLIASSLFLLVPNIFLQFVEVILNAPLLEFLNL